eukprot:Sspe_Gene.38411::Locus_18513_Transcript_1_3_Confidence_0.750_Length_749::g.38411::m.38411/K06928/NTPCR; nucleoside-triphosphatase
MSAPGLPAVGRYSVQVGEFEKFCLPILREAVQGLRNESKRVLIIDEIGKMELFSKEFVRLMTALLEEDTASLFLICTIALRGGGFIAEAKEFATDLIEVTPANRNGLVSQLERRIDGFLATAPSPRFG